MSRRDGRARNGHSGNSGEAYDSNAVIPTCYQALLRRLIDNSRRGVETSASECAEAGRLQYQTRIFEARKKSWPIIRERGRHDLLAIVFPGEYSNGALAITPPPPAENRSLFAEPDRRGGL